MIRKIFGRPWFFEDFIPGEPQTSLWGFLVEKEIYAAKTPFQEIKVFQNSEFGRLLLLDNMIQLSTRHEYVYHEMLVQPAMISHDNPQKVLIIGGGDGGVAREVLKHPVKKVFLVDIDPAVTSVSQKYLPTVSAGAFQDKRLKVFNQDARGFVKKYRNYFDVIVYDLTDPGGPSLALWQPRFFYDIRKSLKPKGIAAFQTGYLMEKFGRKARRNLQKVFPFFAVHRAFVGCFPFDEHSFSFASPKTNLARVRPTLVEKRFRERKIATRYYSPSVHFSSRVLLHHD